MVLCYHVSWSIKFKPKNFAEKDSKMKRNRQLMLVLIAVSSFMILVVISAVLLLASRVKSEYTAEVGQEISTDAFRRFDWDKGAFIWLENRILPCQAKEQENCMCFRLLMKLH